MYWEIVLFLKKSTLKVHFNRSTTDDTLNAVLHCATSEVLTPVPLTEHPLFHKHQDTCLPTVLFRVLGSYKECRVPKPPHCSLKIPVTQDRCFEVDLAINASIISLTFRIFPVTQLLLNTGEQQQGAIRAERQKLMKIIFCLVLKNLWVMSISMYSKNQAGDARFPPKIQLV